MSDVQLVVKYAGRRGIINCPMVIHSSKMRGDSDEFYVMENKKASSMIIITGLIGMEEYQEKLGNFLSELCRCDTIQLMIEKRAYIVNREEIQRVIENLKRLYMPSEFSGALLLYYDGEVETKKKVEVRLFTD